MTETPCDHRFEYVGLRYRDGNFTLPGGSAKPRYYGHVYVCSRCLTPRTTPVDGIEQDTYCKVLDGALPAAEGEVPLPRNQQSAY